jgi:hypothetical protein
MKNILVINKPVQELIAEICAEHQSVCKTKDSNMGYLWFMYTEGTKKGTFKPFIFLAELNLLVKTGLLLEEEKERLVEMMSSEDLDNFFLVALSIKQLREQRINQYGLYNESFPIYMSIDYSTEIIDPGVFLNKVTPYTL